VAYYSTTYLNQITNEQQSIISQSWYCVQCRWCSNLNRVVQEKEHYGEAVCGKKALSVKCWHCALLQASSIRSITANQTLTIKPDLLNLMIQNH